MFFFHELLFIKIARFMKCQFSINFWFLINCKLLIKRSILSKFSLKIKFNKHQKKFYPNGTASIFIRRRWRRIAWIILLFLLNSFRNHTATLWYHNFGTVLNGVLNPWVSHWKKHSLLLSHRSSRTFIVHSIFPLKLPDPLHYGRTHYWSLWDNCQ